MHLGFALAWDSDSRATSAQKLERSLVFHRNRPRPEAGLALGNTIVRGYLWMGWPGMGRFITMGSGDTGSSRLTCGGHNPD
jgi:hypothetical protein